MKTAIAKMFMKIDGIKNPKQIENYEDLAAEAIDGIRQHIIKPCLKAMKWITIAFVIVNLLMLVFGESRSIEDWSALDRLRYEWHQLRRMIDWHIL